MCNFGIWITGVRIQTTKANSYVECRQKCRKTAGCSYWKFKTSNSNCKMYSEITSRDNGYNDYVTGSRLCILPEDEGTWGKKKMSSVHIFLIHPFQLLKAAASSSFLPRTSYPVMR